MKPFLISKKEQGLILMPQADSNRPEIGIPAKKLILTTKPALVIQYGYFFALVGASICWVALSRRSFSEDGSVAA
jgi:hypothetical protein